MVSAGLALYAAKHEARLRLAAAGCENAAAEADLLLEKALGAPAWQLGARTALNEAQAAALEALLVRREAREPLQYLLGSWGFYDLTLDVGPGVLCPRADTETVVEAVLDAVRQAPPAPADDIFRILDLCAGTGAIGLALHEHLPDAEVTLAEKSSEAFRYLERNARRAAAPARIRLKQSDLFTLWRALPEAHFSVITCNPPYLTGAEMAALQPETAHEPAMALDGGADGLDFYRALAAHYQRTLVPGGLLALEIGWQQRESVCGLLRAAHWQEPVCVRDLAGNDRCVLARRPLESALLDKNGTTNSCNPRQNKV